MADPFTKILVGTDFSDPAARALDRAIDLAHRYGAKLHLVHAWDPPAITYGAIASMALDVQASYERSAREQLEHRVAERVAELRARGTELESTLAQGVPWEQILEVAERVGADLIVVGTHGRKGLQRALLGSVAERVMRLSTVPVMVVR